MNTMWDIWQYRNQLVFADDGELQTDEQNEINNLIYQEFVIGGIDLLDNDQFLFEDYNLDELLTSDTETKRAWIDSINAARRAINLPEEEQHQPENDPMTQLSLDYFGWIDK